MNSLQLPPHLEYEVRLARTALEKHPQSNVTLGYRRAIYNAMDDVHVDTANNLGRNRRLHAGIIAVLHELPIWEKIAPNNPTPVLLIEIALEMKRLNIRFDPKATLPHPVLRFLKAGWKYCERISNEWEALGIVTSPLYILEAALRLTTVARTDEILELSTEGYGLEAGDIYDYDIAGWIVDGVSGGWLMSPNMNRDKRKEFWIWWLEECVPNAYHLVPI
jgi:hypothetical protein